MRRLIATTSVVCALAAPAAAHADLELSGTALPRTGYTLLGVDRSTEANNVTVTQDPATSAWQITDAAGISVLPAECTRVSDTQASCAGAPFNVVSFELNAGADVLQATGPYKAIGPQQGELVDLIATMGGGRDRFGGGGGSNGILGGKGRDRLVGGPALDNLFGGPGPDRLIGRDGKDFLAGDRGNDSLFAGPGLPDLMLGGKGRDRCVGQGRDRVGGCEKVGLVR